MLGNINEMITLVMILFTNAIVICIVTGVKERAHGGLSLGFFVSLMSLSHVTA